MPTWLGVLVVLAPVAVVVALVVVVRSGVVYRSERYVRWRRRKSARDRGTMSAEAPSPEGGTDPTAGASF